MVVAGTPRDDVLKDVMERALAEVDDASLRDALSDAVAEIIIGRHLGVDVYAARASALAVLDKIGGTDKERAGRLPPA